MDEKRFRKMQSIWYYLTERRRGRKSAKKSYMCERGVHEFVSVRFPMTLSTFSQSVIFSSEKWRFHQSNPIVVLNQFYCFLYILYVWYNLKIQPYAIDKKFRANLRSTSTISDWQGNEMKIRNSQLMRSMERINIQQCDIRPNCCHKSSPPSRYTSTNKKNNQQTSVNFSWVNV